jgi:hypothetical protein
LSALRANKNLQLSVRLDASTVLLEEGFTRDVRQIRHAGTGDLEISMEAMTHLIWNRFAEINYTKLLRRMSLSARDRLGPCEILTRIGEGGMGERSWYRPSFSPGLSSIRCRWRLPSI